MKLDPYRRPRRSALLLALGTLAGLIGLLAFDGLIALPTFLLAATPFAFGLYAWLRARFPEGRMPR